MKKESEIAKLDRLLIKYKCKPLDVFVEAWQCTRCLGASLFNTRKNETLRRGGRRAELLFL